MIVPRGQLKGIIGHFSETINRIGVEKNIINKTALKNF